MSNIPFSLSHESVTVFLDGVPHTHHTGTVQYNQLRDALGRNADPQEIRDLLAPGGALGKYLGSTFSVQDGKILYGAAGVELPAGLASRIQGMADAGEDPSPLLRFYERLDKNPSFLSRTQLFNFMKHCNIAIEPDGTFLAYKGLKDDYTDCHTGTVDNSPGTVNKMARNLISDDPTKHCHFGFHVGALSYATGFAQGAVVICRVDPENVVCVPDDHDAQKMRVCEYEVVGEWNEQVVTSTDASEMESSSGSDEDYDEDYDEDDDEIIEQTSGVPSDLITRADLAPGTVFEYVQSPGATFAVNNVALWGAPKALLREMAPSMDQPVTIIWSTADVRTPEPLFVQTEPEITVEVKKIPNFRVADAKKLMEKSIEDLRLYASKRLKIAGASKIAGGKAALVSKILQVRRRRAKAGK